ncbi:hypothetical protein [Niveispirillum sp. KHB5.9]|uniref:hypothetical protein n=1 Tax=Niveispirillum sp. KHB5.9 TaxID=3400269 RepID=UPI003A8BB46F
MTARADQHSRQRGIALPMALWVSMALALLAAGIAATAGQATRRQAGADQLAQARALVDTGISLGVMLAVHPDPARQLAADGRPVMLAEPEGEVTLRLWDEAGRMDLNRTPQARILAVAARLLPADQLGALTTALAQRRSSGGEPWNSTLELGAFLSPDAFARLYPLLTVHGPVMAEGAVSLRAMPPVLRARWPGLVRGMQDPGVLAGLGLTPSGPPSTLFTLRVTARTPQGAVASAEALVWITIQGAQAFHILEWREPAPAIAADDEAS